MVKRNTNNNSKKGDLTECSNWRGITSLSTPSKVLGNIIIEQIKEVLDEKLRKEQAAWVQIRKDIR
jgi:hypothetical protein